MTASEPLAGVKSVNLLISVGRWVSCRSWSVWTRFWRRRRWSSRRWCWSWRPSRSTSGCRFDWLLCRQRCFWVCLCVSSSSACVATWRQRPGWNHPVAPWCGEREGGAEQFDLDAAEIHRGRKATSSQEDGTWRKIKTNKQTKFMLKPTMWGINKSIDGK